MILLPVSQLIAKYLFDLSIVVAPGVGDWVGYIANMAATPDNAICVYDLDATQDGRIIKTGERIEHPAFQVRIRGKDYAGAWSKGIDVRDALDAVKKTTVVIATDTFLLHSVMRTSSLIPLGTDPETGLINFTLNAQLTVSLVAP